MDAAKSTFLSALKDFDELTCNPELFIEPTLSKAEGLQNVAKKFHQHSVEANSLTRLKANSLRELLVDGFDEEQIWQQIELQSKPAAFYLHKSLSKLDTNDLGFGLNTESLTKKVNFVEGDVSNAEPLSDDDDQVNFSDEANKSDDSDFDEQNQLSDSDSDEYVEIEKPKSILKKSAEEIVENSNDNAEKLDCSVKSPNQRRYKCEVDDQFFKVSKLAQFLRIEDLKEERARDGVVKEDDKESEESSSDDEDEDIDLFQDVLSDDLDESGDEEMADKKSSRDLMYEDFFDAPDSGDENGNEDEASDVEQDDDVDEKMDVSEDEGSEEEDDLHTETVPDKDPNVPKTPFQLEQEKIKQKIEEYEEKMLKPAAWHLTGEVDSSARPIDALLHLQTDFEMNAKPVVIQDKTLCEKLESMLKLTIKNKSFSDGVKQFKTNDEIIAKKKEVVIEQTKSKKSLTQEYEDMYLKKKHGQEEVENPKHKEIKKLMDSLFPELQALFSHIPKPAIPDITIVNNLPAISLEEVAPTSVSDVTLLAPEEVKKRTGVVKGKTERTDVDRKQERRKKKFHQKMKQKKREKENSDKPLSAKAQKREKIDMIRKLKQQRNTKFAKMDGQKVKSSKDFFERLQDTVSATVSKMRAKKS